MELIQYKKTIMVVKMKRFFALLLIVILLSGCSIDSQDKEKIRDLEYTVVEKEDVPDELMKIINEKKGDVFKITFKDNDYLYIVVGYGKQPTGGYSIAVEELYLTNNAIYINTTLIGPSKEEKISQVITYPYIVIKTEYLEHSVVFR